jgi:hypothetical protein
MLIIFDFRAISQMGHDGFIGHLGAGDPVLIDIQVVNNIRTRYHGQMSLTSRFLNRLLWDLEYTLSEDGSALNKLVQAFLI